MSFCSITADRGDRKPFMDFCKHQISRMTVKPDKSYFIDWSPQSKDFDLITRVKDGIHQALHEGFNEVYILESDDWYPANYFEIMKLNGCDFIGQNNTTYYNLRNRTWQTMSHPKRSSLFVTGFKLSAMKDFVWPQKHERSLDISLWKHAQKFKTKFIETQAIGMKHNIGLVGGIGHRLYMKNSDPNMEWLKSKVDQESFVFYKSLNL